MDDTTDTASTASATPTEPIAQTIPDVLSSFAARLTALESSVASRLSQVESTVSAIDPNAGAQAKTAVNYLVSKYFGATEAAIIEDVVSKL